MEGIRGHFITTRDFTGEPSILFDKPYNYLPLCSSPHLDVLFGKLRGGKIKTLLDGYGGDHCATCSSQIPLREFLPGFQAIRLMRYIRAASVGSGRSVPRVVGGLMKACFRKIGRDDIDELFFPGRSCRWGLGTHGYSGTSAAKHFFNKKNTGVCRRL